MNLKTTFVLFLLVGAGAGAGVWLHLRKPTEVAASESIEFLHDKLKLDKLTHVEVTRPHKPLEAEIVHAGTISLLCSPLTPNFVAASTLFPQAPQTLVVLEKGRSGWMLPGNWPVRPNETKDWLAVLTSLRSRFAPIPLGDNAELVRYGLDETPLIIKATIDGKPYVLRFGESPDDTNRFTRSTFMRLEDKDEIIQLGPGVFTALNRAMSHFRKLQLFDKESVAKSEGSVESVDQLEASAVEVQSKDAKFVVAKKDKEWILQKAFTKKEGKDKPETWQGVAAEDRLDPARRDAFLRGFPDLWADKFVDNRSIEACGLKEPEYTVTVTRMDGTKVKLLIGKVSLSNTRSELKKGPPGAPPQITEVTEEWRYAKLDENEQIFEIKADKLPFITLDFAKLRDPLLARFKTDDVKRLEIRLNQDDVVLVKAKEDEKEKDKDKEKWRFDKPTKGDADAKAVEELLEKLAALQAEGKTVHDDADMTKFGLDTPHGSIKVTLEELEKDQKADDKDAKRKTRTVVYQLGVKDKEDDKLFVRVEGWKRVNEFGADIRKLMTRTDLAYRPRELWHADREDLKRITIEAGGAPYHLEPTDKGLKFGPPLNIHVDSKELEALVVELAHVTAERFEANEPKDLARYGLDKPEFKITREAKDGKTYSLEIGNRVKEPQGGRYARLKDGKAVVVVSEKLTGLLRKDPLELFDRVLWHLKLEDVQRIRWQGSASFALEQKKGPWQVVDAPIPSFIADEPAARSAVMPLLQPRAEKFVALGDKLDLAKYGLDKPAATIIISRKDGDKTPDLILVLGKEAPGGGRYAQVKPQNGVVVLDADLVEDILVTHLDFVDRRVLKFDGDAVMTIDRKMKGNDVELTRREDAWIITKPGTRDADILTIVDVLRKTSQFQAKRIAASDLKDLKRFGLDNPTAVVTLQLESPDGSVAKHIIKVGDLAKDKTKKDTDERFALIDDRPLVVVLPADLSRHLVAPVLYFADRNLAAFASIDWIELTRGPRKAVFSRTDAGWRMKQPVDAPAEAKVIDEIIQSLQRLRVDEIVAIADKTTDLKKYGLDKPFLQWRFKMGDTEQLNLIVGGLEKDEPGARRYAKLGDKAPIFLLGAKLTAKVQNEVRDRSPWSQAFDAGAVTKLTVSNGGKTFALIRKESNFQSADEPAAKVNQTEVTDTLNILGSFKVHGYLTDAKAELKAFGLDNPVWKIEAEVGKDKRVLLLGDHEDKSKRLYATIPGSGAVFVIDVIDAHFLARPRSAYIEEPKKTEEKKGSTKKQVLLLWQSPDGHPKDTHEYQLGQKILKHELDKFADLEVTLVNADEPWQDGPELLAKADGVVLFISEGAKWLSADPKRLEAIRACAKRKGGLAVLHWGMGTKDAKNIDGFVELFGGCHGGPDRKYQVVSTDAKAVGKHPSVNGLGDFKVRDEFYYTLKFAKNKTPLLNVMIDGEAHPVAWALERDGGGRSFGFSGLHFHENWQMPEYRRLVSQGVLWTLDVAIPKDGIKVN